MPSLQELVEHLLQRVTQLEGRGDTADASPRQRETQEESLAAAVAEAHGLELLDASDGIEALDAEFAAKVPRGLREKHRVAPIRESDGVARVASDGPPTVLRKLRRLLEVDEIEWCITTATGLDRLLVAIDIGEVTRGRALAESQHEPADDLLTHDLGRQTEAVRVLESILIEAAAERASDVHLEAHPEGARVRIRVDGILRELSHYALTHAQLAPVVRIAKVRAGIDIVDHRMPCGGQFEMHVGGRQYFVRVQSQPTVLAENLALRLLPQDPQLEHIEDLGFCERDVRLYRRLLASPGGMVLVAGPTGSGKTTTLYAGLRVLADDERRRVITVEDPVETIIPGAQQVQVDQDSDFGFADAMRVFVREDPDAILIGEIRDPETALEAIRASQTGHVVLSTIHSNDAIDSIQRLRDLGMHPNSIATELTAIFAQRLAPRICPHCKEQATPPPQLVEEVFDGAWPDDLECWRGAGCERCRDTGRLGRIAVVECLSATPDLRRAISRNDLVDDLRELAREQGLVTLRERALELVAEGIVAFEDLPHFIPLERLRPVPGR